MKKVVHKCNQCKRYRVKSLPAPPQSMLPEFRAQLSDPFVVTGVDFAGPILYKIKKSTFGKSYVALFTCSSTVLGQKPPRHKPLDKNPPCQKPPRQNILFRNFITFVFRMSYGKEISIWFLAVKYIRHGSIK